MFPYKIPWFPPPIFYNPSAASARCIWYLRRTFASSRRIFGSSDLMFVWWNGGRKVDRFTGFHPPKKRSNMVKLVDLMWLWIKELSILWFIISNPPVMMNIDDTFQWRLVMWCSHTGLIPIKSWEVQQNYPVRRIRIWAIKFRIYSHDIAVKGCKRM